MEGQLRGWRQMMIDPVPAQRRQLIRKPCIIRLLHLPAGCGGLAGGLASGNPAELAAIRLGVAPTLLLRFTTCLPGTAIPLSMGHRLGPQLPSDSGSVRGCDPLRIPCIGLRGVILVVILAGGWWLGRAGVRRHARVD